MEIRAKIEGLDETIKLLNKKTINQVLNRTANEEGRRFATYMAKEIRKEYNIKSSMIKSKTNVKKAAGDSNTFTLDISSSRLDLSLFLTSVVTKRVVVRGKKKKYMARRKIAKVRVKRGKAKAVKGAFIVNNKLFKRTTKSRLPIKKLFTISVTEMFRKDIVDEAFKVVEKHYPKTLERNFNFYISKAIKK